MSERKSAFFVFIPVWRPEWFPSAPGDAAVSGTSRPGPATAANVQAKLNNR